MLVFGSENRPHETDAIFGGAAPENRWVVDQSHVLMSFDTCCPFLHRPGSFQPNDRWAGWDSHRQVISDFQGVLV
jgi:hypothetical protein